MYNFKDFKFNLTYHLVGHLRNKIIKNSSDDYLEDYFEVEKKEFQGKALKPSKKTLLHDYLECEFQLEIEYVAHKVAGEKLEDDWADLLTDYKVKFSAREEYYKQEDGNYTNYLESIIIEKLTEPICDEVFTLLFNDRYFLQKFNELIAEKVKKIKKVDYPTFLADDGKIIRCLYWPEWLKRAIYYRDKGSCAICICDLSGLIRTDFKDAIDHIVPLNLGGTNDITNLQLVCEGCNLKKLKHTIKTSTKYVKYF